MTHFCYCDLHDIKKGVCRVSKLVNNSWPVGMIQNWGWEVEAHVPTNILVVCHTVKCSFTLAICSLHQPCDNICCLDIVHVVPESGFYVIFHSSCFDVPSPSVALFGILAPKLSQQQSQNLQAFYKWRSLQVHDQLFQAACCCCYFVVGNKSTEYVAWKWGYQVTCYCALSLIVVYSLSQ